MAGNIVVGILRALLTADTAEFEDGLRKATTQSESFGKGMEKVGGQMQDVGKAVLPISLAITGLGVAAVAVGMDFEKSMNAIQGVLQPTGAEMEQVRALAMQLGADTVFSATDAANAMLELGKAGFTTQQSMAAARDVINLAAASGLSMADAAEMAARTLNAFGLQTTDLAHVNDVLAKAVNASSLNIDDLRLGFQYVGPIAKGFGMSIEQTSAALAIMRDNGIAAETSGRALREGLSRLANPTKAVDAVMTQLSISTFESGGKLMNLSQIVQLLGDKNITAAQALKLFGDAAGPGMYALIQEGRPALDGLTTSLRDSDGAAKAMADAMMNGLPGAMEKMRGSVDTALLSIEKALEPSLIRVIKLLEGLADWISTEVMPAFQSLSPEMQTAIVVFGGIVAVLGPLLIALGAFVAALGAAIPVLMTVGAAVLAFATGPIALIGIAIAGLALIWYKWGDDVTKFTRDTFNAITHYFVDVFNDAVESVRKKVDAVTGFFKGMYEDVVGHSYVPDMVAGIGKHFAKLQNDMVAPADAATRAVTLAYAVMTQDMVTQNVKLGKAVLELRATFDTTEIKNFMMTMGALQGEISNTDLAVSKGVGGMKNSLNGLVGGFQKGLGDLWEGMSGGKGFAGLMGNLGDSLVSGFGNILSGGLSKVIDMGIGLAVEGVKKLAGIIGGMFQSEETKKVNKPRDQFFAQFGGGSDADQYQHLADKLTGAVGGDAASGLIKALYDADTEAKFKTAQQAIVDLIGGNVFAGGTPGLDAVDFGAGQLAMLHGPEFVVPESRVGEFVARHGPDQVINIYQDGVLTTQRVVRNMPRVLALHGVG